MKEVKFDNVGFSVRELTSSEMKTFKVNNGVIISDVKPYGEAFNKRLSKGLVITEVDKKKIDSVSEFEKILKGKEGDAVLLKVVTEDETTRFVGLEITK
jgi:S1-C subfamily serine protease